MASGPLLMVLAVGAAGGAGGYWYWKRQRAGGSMRNGGGRGVELSSQRHNYEPVAGEQRQQSRENADDWNRAADGGSSPQGWNSERWDDDW